MNSQETTTKNNGAVLTAEQAAEICKKLEQTSTTINQMSGVFGALEYWGSGDQRQSPERRLADVINAVSAIGEMGRSSLDGLIADISDIQSELGRLCALS